MITCPECGGRPIPPQCPTCGKAAPRRRGPTMTIVELVIILLVVSVLAAILVPNFIKARPRGSLTTCKSNLKNTATALEMYSTDNLGKYPPKLAALTPNYQKVIPNCPLANKDTYSASYQMHTEPDAFTIYCSGKNHESANLPKNYPQYSSLQGLIER